MAIKGHTCLELTLKGFLTMWTPACFLQASPHSQLISNPTHSTAGVCTKQKPRVSPGWLYPGSSGRRKQAPPLRIFHAPPLAAHCKSCEFEGLVPLFEGCSAAPPPVLWIVS